MGSSCGGGDETNGKGGPHCPFKGVRKTSSGQWAAEIVDPHRGALLWLGTYLSSLEAALAYDHKARKLYGPDADVNVPDLVVCSPDNSDNELEEYDDDYDDVDVGGYTCFDPNEVLPDTNHNCHSYSDPNDILSAATPEDSHSDSDSNDVVVPTTDDDDTRAQGNNNQLKVMTAPIPIPTKTVNNVVVAPYSRSAGSEESVNSYVPTNTGGVRVVVEVVGADRDDELDKCIDFDGVLWDNFDVDLWLETILDLPKETLPPNKPDGDNCEGPAASKKSV